MHDPARSGKCVDMTAVEAVIVVAGVIGNLMAVRRDLVVGAFPRVPTLLNLPETLKAAETANDSVDRDGETAYVGGSPLLTRVYAASDLWYALADKEVAVALVSVASQ